MKTNRIHNINWDTDCGQEVLDEGRDYLHPEIRIIASLYGTI
jgi:hypothetical protein